MSPLRRVASHLLRGRMTVLLLLILVSPGWAAPPADLDPDSEAARKHFEMGRRFYGREDYPRALAEFLAAGVIKPMPAFEYNVALCYERMESYSAAILAYRRFVAVAADSAEAAEARNRIALLLARIHSLDRIRGDAAAAAASVNSSQDNRTQGLPNRLRASRPVSRS